MKKPPLVEVVWIDAIERDESCKLSEARSSRLTNLYTRVTAGYLVRQDDEVVSVVREFDPPEPDDEEPTVGKFCNIPAGWVKKITYKAPKPRARKGKADATPPTEATSD
jgi:hypothetical protein